MLFQFAILCRTTSINYGNNFQAWGKENSPTAETTRPYIVFEEAASLTGMVFEPRLSFFILITLVAIRWFMIQPCHQLLYNFHQGLVFLSFSFFLFLWFSMDSDHRPSSSEPIKAGNQPPPHYIRVIECPLCIEASEQPSHYRSGKIPITYHGK